MHMAFGLTIARSLEDVCNPRDMALVVYDMQVGIVRQVRNGPALVERVAEALAAARRCGMRVVYTRHLSLPPEWMGASQFRMAMAWQKVEDPREVRPWFLRDSPDFAIVPELAPRASEAIFDKITMSAFAGTPLAIAVRDCGLRAIALVGIALEVGIEPTARHAADLGIVPVIVSEACGSGNEEAARRSVAALEYAGDTLFASLASFRQLLSQEGGVE